MNAPWYIAGSTIPDLSFDGFGEIGPGTIVDTIVDTSVDTSLELLTEALANIQTEDGEDILVDTLFADGAGDNLPDPLLNLALTADATVSSSLPNLAGAARGTPEAIIYDPSNGEFAASSPFAEFGYAFSEDVPILTESDPYTLQVDWATSKSINLIQLAGGYPNQPHPTTQWKVQYKSNGSWVTLDSGTGGWVDSGLYTWGGAGQAFVTADAFRVICYGDVDSLALRGRGAAANNVDDSSESHKAILIQLLA